MNNFKRIITVLFAILLVLGLAAYNETAEDEQEA